MKAVLVLCLVAVAAASKYYDAKWDEFPLDQIVADLPQFKALGNCFSGKKPCSPDNLEAKGVFTDAFATACKKCSPKQRVLFRKGLLEFQSKTPEVWADLRAALDPKGTAYPALERFLNSSH